MPNFILKISSDNHINLENVIFDSVNRTNTRDLILSKTINIEKRNAQGFETAKALGSIASSRVCPGYLHNRAVVFIPALAGNRRRVKAHQTRDNVKLLLVLLLRV